jgi:hypothetical protein
VINRYVGNLAPMPGVFPDYPAPVIRNTDTGTEMRLMRWRMPLSYGLLASMFSLRPNEVLIIHEAKYSDDATVGPKYEIHVSAKTLLRADVVKQGLATLFAGNSLSIEGLRDLLFCCAAKAEQQSGRELRTRDFGPVGNRWVPNILAGGGSLRVSER